MDLLKFLFATLLLFLLKCNSSNFAENELTLPVEINSEGQYPDESLKNTSAIPLEGNEQPMSFLIRAVEECKLNKMERLLIENPKSVKFEKLKVAIKTGCENDFKILLDQYNGDLFNREFNQNIFEIIAIKAWKENDSDSLFGFACKVFEKLDFNSKLALIEHIACEYSDPKIVDLSIEAVSHSLNPNFDLASGESKYNSSSNQVSAFYWFLRTLSFKIDSVKLFKLANRELHRCNITDEGKELINNYIEYVKNNTGEKVEYFHPEDFIHKDIELFKKQLNDIISGAEKRPIGIRVLEAIIDQSDTVNKPKIQEAFCEFCSERDKAFLYAVENGNEDDVKRLLAIATDINSRIANGSTALMLAIKGGNEIIFNALLKKGADLDAQNNWREFALMLAVEMGYKNIVNVLLKNSANVNAQNNGGETALMCGADIGNEDIVDALLKYNADVNLANYQGYTALMYAAEKGHKTIVNALLEKGADVNAQNDEKYTALMYAAENGHESIVKALLKIGADASLKNVQGMTALNIAQMCKQQNIVAILSYHEAKMSANAY